MEIIVHYVSHSSMISGSRPAVGSGVMRHATTSSSLGRWPRATKRHS
jgi:hypothetical protein